jgi:predicted ATPase
MRQNRSRSPGSTSGTFANEDTGHYRITRDFLNTPERFLRRLMPKSGQ